MIIRSFSGEESITELCTGSMVATIQALVKAGHLDKSVADKFIDSHIAILSSDESYWSRIKKATGWANSKSDFVAIMEIK